jgi:hypothetical protein
MIYDVLRRHEPHEEALRSQSGGAGVGLIGETCLLRTENRGMHVWDTKPTELTALMREE